MCIKRGGAIIRDNGDQTYDQCVRDMRAKFDILANCRPNSFATGLCNMHAKFGIFLAQGAPIIGVRGDYCSHRACNRIMLSVS